MSSLKGSGGEVGAPVGSPAPLRWLDDFFRDAVRWLAPAAPPEATEGERPPGYPAHLERDLTLDDGRRVHVRPILPADAPALAEAAARADPETLRLRFLAPGRRLSPAEVRHLVEVDYVRRLALVAFDGEGEGVAVARYEGGPTGDEAEVAVVVAPEWRRVGLGTRLLELVGQAAGANGIRWLTADYLAENQEVVRLLAASGLPYVTEVDGDLASVRIDLQAALDVPPGA